MTSLEVEILKTLLSESFQEDISVRKIAKKLDRPVSHIFYYLKKMHKQGILIKDEHLSGFVRYIPNDIFDTDIEISKKLLRNIAEGIEDCTENKLANCISLFLKINKL